MSCLKFVFEITTDIEHGWVARSKGVKTIGGIKWQPLYEEAEDFIDLQDQCLYLVKDIIMKSLKDETNDFMIEVIFINDKPFTMFPIKLVEETKFSFKFSSLIEKFKES